MIKTPKLRFKEFSGEWKSKRLGKITKLTDGVHFTPTYVESGVPFWSVETIVSNANPKYITEEAHNDAIKRCYPQLNDILLTRIGTLAKPKLIDWNEEFSIYVSLALIKASDNYNSKFARYYFETEYYQKDFLSKSLLTATPKKINMEDLKQTNISLPSKEEQEKIASFFSLIDDKISLQSEKVEALKDYKKGMMQKIFSRELRFKDNDGRDYPEWEEKKLGDVLKSRIEKQVPSQEAPLMSFTATGGIEPKGERYDRSFLVKSNSKLYKRTELNDFIYSSNNLDVGSIGLNKYGTAVISDVYEIFNVSKEASCDFISELIQTPRVLNKVIRYRQGVMYGQYRIHADEFLKIREFMPCLEEQNKISTFISNIEVKIEKEQEKLKYLNGYKKGLLQQMFV